MVIYHFFFDLYFLGFAAIDPLSFPFLLLARSVAIIFLFLVGFSYRLSSLRHQKTTLLPHTLKRAISIFIWASLISFATYLLEPGLMVRFGILHLIAISLVFLYPLTLLKPIFAKAAYLFLILFAGRSLQNDPLPSFDYFPLFPWFTVVALGFIVSEKFPQKTSAPPRSSLETISFSISKNSLAIYLLHQPVILFALQMLKVFHLP